MLTWNDNLTVGIDKVDTQHKKLINIVNDYTNACRNARGKQEIEKLLKFLEGYVIEHFKDEEHFMKVNNYPDYLTHKQAHDEFSKQVSELLKEIQIKGPNLTTLVTTNKAVSNWLVSHILQMDKAFGSFVKDTN